VDIWVRLDSRMLPSILGLIFNLKIGSKGTLLNSCPKTKISFQTTSWVQKSDPNRTSFLGFLCYGLGSQCNFGLREASTMNLSLLNYNPTFELKSFGQV